MLLKNKFYSKRQVATTRDDNVEIGKRIDERMDILYADIMSGLPHKDIVFIEKNDKL